MPSAGKVISLDPVPVSCDLDSIPLDDILDFRAEHRGAHKSYMRDLRRFMTELADVDDTDERERLLVERQQDIADAARDLQRSTRRRLGKNLASLSFGLAGAAWSTVSGGLDPLSAALAAAGITASQLVPDHPSPITAYSYIFATQKQFGSAGP